MERIMKQKGKSTVFFEVFLLSLLQGRHVSPFLKQSENLSAVRQCIFKDGKLCSTYLKNPKFGSEDYLIILIQFESAYSI